MRLRTCLLMVMLLPAGCRSATGVDYSELNLIDVSGQVTLDGIALAGAQVDFVNSDATRSAATTDAHGRYRLMFNSEQPGCLPGEKLVRIRMAPARADLEDPDAAPSSGVVIPARYNTESQLTANVSATQRTFDFALKSGEDAPSASDVGGGQ